MKFIRHARQQARACRNQIGVSSENLLARIEKYLWDKYQIELIAVHYSTIEDGRAELRPAESCLLYDERLNATPDEKLFVIAHELGHLELHGRLTRRGSAPDPVYGSMYWNAGTSALTRYNSRSQEEAEANAFAAEFLCPCEEVFAQWRSDSQKDSRTLAEQLSAPLSVVRMQLAEAVYQMAFGNEDHVARKDFACDDSQETAARSVGMPVLVDAGPGTGKTATLVRRIEYLLGELKAEPENMLVLTFSNDAAAELEERVAFKFGSSVAARIRISTFHGFGLAFLQHHGQLRDLDANVCVLDEAGQAELVTEILGTVNCAKILELSRPDETVREIVRHIGYLKDRLCNPDGLAREIDGWRAGPGELSLRESALSFLEVFRAYEKACAERQRVDFADLISEPIEILAQQPELKEKYCDKYKWVLVDEYQDVSRATAILLQCLCGSNNPPWVVGDKRQSIFRFRGAAPENVDEFARDFPDAVKYSLGVNYRSCSEIVTVANGMARLMKISDESAVNVDDYWRAAESNPGSIGPQPVTIAIADSDPAEYDGIADQVQTWLRALEKKKVSIARMREMIFGKKSERFNQQEKAEEKKNGTESTGESGEGAEKSEASNSPKDGKQDSSENASRRRGSGGGRKPASAYVGAKVVHCSHQELQAGNNCLKEGCKGRIYPVKRQHSELQFTGQPIIVATHYKQDVLKCNCCDKEYEAPLPAGVTPGRYDATADAAIAISKSIQAVPYHRTAALQELCGIPLPESVQSERCGVVAIILSVLASCRLNGTNPWNYLVSVLRRKEEVKKNAKDFLPWNYQGEQSEQSEEAIAA